MPLINRLARLFRADVHAVLDQIEEPGLLLRQAVRDMEDAVADGDARRAALIRCRDANRARHGEIALAQARMGGELALCLDAGNESLARLMLRRRLEGERLQAHLDRECGRLDAAVQELERDLADQREALQRFRQQAAVHAPTPPDDSAGAAPPWSAESFAVTDADVELALLREQRSRA
jgi:phage shock protein A